VPGSQVVDARTASADPQASRFAGWQAFLAVHRACRLGDPSAFARSIDDARARLGGSPELAELAAQCRSLFAAPPAGLIPSSP
jgi:hypothetical protein